MSVVRKSVVIFYNSEKPAARQEIPRLRSWFRKKGCRVLSPVQAAQGQMAVALGGDGTLLLAARRLAPLGIPVLGINLGRLGFLAGTDVRRMYQALTALLQGQLSLSRRMMVWVRPSRGDGQLALNDCVIRVGGSARVIRLSVSVNGAYLGTYVGDGLILSTPTGSTAYSLAASGPIVEPEMELMLLTPICSHSLTQRPIILSAQSVLEICVEEHDRRDRVILSLDGQHSFPLRVKDRIQVKQAPHPLKIFCDDRRPYFSLLREKLKWGER